MDKSIVEQCREYYPMTFYADSLAKILARIKGTEEQNNSIFYLEPIPLIIKQVHYYNEIGLKQFFCGCLTIFLLAITIVIVLLFNQLIAIAFLLFTSISFFGYCSLQRYKNNLRKELINIEQKLRSRQYKIKVESSININPSAANLLLDSLAERENIYNFTIDDSANKGLSESYFLSYLQKWFSYPWRIIEHCQFQGERYTPTADFILINDNLKLGIDLEIDEPYTLKESTPIHLLEDRKYIIRDKFFLELGYIVIRFAEYQIAKYPDYCCLHIVRVLNQFLDRDLKISLPHATEIQPLKPQNWRVKTWTLRESQIMAENKIRDRYLESVKAFNLKQNHH
ncbi:MAG: hypothetical protein HC930_04890 [Hydrococcus sp. SU_1_0]|nr:hypothetical protein [Hydrococcus sp. SU_1_0]NJO97716.1 hypothetical protein [Pleurocapsa sp. CRU_1_2]